MMAKKNSKWIVAVIFLLLLLGGGFAFQSFSSQGLTIFEEQVWIPDYYSAECVTRPEHMSEVSLGSVPSSGEFYECTTDGTGKWIPKVPNVQCEYFIKHFGLSVTVKECPLTARDDDDCTTVRNFWTISGDEDRVTIDQGKKLWIDPVWASVGLTAKFPSYGLRVRQAGGFLPKISTNCVANSVHSIIDNVHLIDASSSLEVAPLNPINVITGLRLAISSHLVTLNGVNNGRPIYITRAGYGEGRQGFYYKVLELDDGFTYVDSNREFGSVLIECIPRTTGCSDDAKIVPLVDQNCGLYGGSITDYAPVQGDNSKLCKYECVNGKLVLTDDCIIIPTDCPDDKPLWDANTGECVSVRTIPKETEETDLFFVWVILGVIGVILLMLIVKVIVDKRSGK